MNFDDVNKAACVEVYGRNSMGGIVSGNYLRAASSHFAVCAAHQAILSFARHIKQTRAILRNSKLPSTLH